ncbi:hypothetical protein JCM10450v2_007148 [Rhodotorula kratochvilovae]
MRSFALLAGLVSLAAAAPLSREALETRDGLCRNAYANAGKFSLPCTAYAATLNCPNGIQGKKGGVVLLVHGTGSTAEETWGNGPYLDLLPDAGPGFDVCTVTIPNRSLLDIQVNSEYIAFLIPHLAMKSATGTIGLVTHSQGGLNAQWALDFWPAYRSLVSSFVALAAPFHGTAEGQPACLVVGLLTAVIQQTVGSNFLDALNVKGNVALVPTTSIYTAYDDVIQPELIAPTSRLTNAKVVRLQEQCSDAYIVDHFIIPFSSYAYYLAVDALTNKAVADVSRVPKTSCAWLVNDVLLADFDRGPRILRQAVKDVLAVVTGHKVQVEPKLESYVCRRGDVTSGCE